MITKLFVYGSLKRGFYNPFALQLQHEAQFLGTAKLRGLLLSLGPYPAVVAQDEGAHYVHGELYEMGSKTEVLLAQLDAYEEYNPASPDTGDYRRDPRTVESEKGPVSAWVYTYNRKWQQLPVIPSGIWPLP